MPEKIVATVLSTQASSSVTTVQIKEGLITKNIEVYDKFGTCARGDLVMIMKLIMPINDKKWQLSEVLLKR